MQPRLKAVRLVVVNGSQPNQKQPKPNNPIYTQPQVKAMKKSISTLLFCLLLLGTTLVQASNDTGPSKRNSSTNNKLSAESSTVTSLYSDIQQNLRMPAKLLQMFEGEQIEVLFTIDSSGQVVVLETRSHSPLLQKQITRSFENLSLQAHELLVGERFSLQLHLKP